MERVILAGLNTEPQEAYEELQELASTAGALTVGTCVQNRETPNPVTFIGSGKVEEIAALAKSLKAGTIIFNHNLKANQQRNLEDITGLKIVDRCTLILDIFARHARTNEGKLQVELAQLSYLYPRLSGRGASFSQTGGGIGTVGPGETKLETDRRAVRNRMDMLKGKLEQVRTQRAIIREGRKSKGFLSGALVGYTNSGKSTLLNSLTKAGVLAENKLFSTLDTTTRKLRLESGVEILLTDTVGFIRNLPASLIAAFRATLEETKYSDVLLIVLDGSKNDLEIQNQTVYNELKALNILDKPRITILNKIDLLDSIKLARLSKSLDNPVPVSALNKKNLDLLAAKISLVYNDLLTKS